MQGNSPMQQPGMRESRKTKRERDARSRSGDLTQHRATLQRKDTCRSSIHSSNTRSHLPWARLCSVRQWASVLSKAEQALQANSSIHKARCRPGRRARCRRNLYRTCRCRDNILVLIPVMAFHLGSHRTTMLRA